MCDACVVMDSRKGESLQWIRCVGFDSSESHIEQKKWKIQQNERKMNGNFLKYLNLLFSLIRKQTRPLTHARDKCKTFK